MISYDHCAISMDENLCNNFFFRVGGIFRVGRVHQYKKKNWPKFQS